MKHHRIELIEEKEDLWIEINESNETNDRNRRNPIETIITNTNGSKRREIIQFKWMIIREWIISNLNRIEFRTIDDSIHSICFCSRSDSITIFGIREWSLSNDNSLQFIQSSEFESSDSSQTIISNWYPFARVMISQNEWSHQCIVEVFIGYFQLEWCWWHQVWHIQRDECAVRHYEGRDLSCIESWGCALAHTWWLKGVCDHKRPRTKSNTTEWQLRDICVIKS